MKKAYLTPETALQKINPQCILAGTIIWDDENYTGSDETHDDENATGPALGKGGYDVWEDEDDEEDL